MSGPANRPKLAIEPDFALGSMQVCPSACRVVADGREVRVEAQTMTVLVVLARAAGGTVSRDELIETCWQGRIVSDDAITRTIAKLRGLAREITPPPFVLETLPKVGYRLTAGAAAVTPTIAGAPDEPQGDKAAPAQADRLRAWRPAMVGVALLISAGAAWTLLPRSAEPGVPKLTAAATQGLPTAAQVSEALILLDVERVRGYLARGWDPNWKLDAEGGNSLQTLFIACERNPTHDRGMVALIAQELVRAGVDTAVKNKWDDTALDIASSPRYCGPRHPVVDYLKSMTPVEANTASAG